MRFVAEMNLISISTFHIQAWYIHTYTKFPLLIWKELVKHEWTREKKSDKSWVKIREEGFDQDLSGWWDNTITARVLGNHKPLKQNYITVTYNAEKKNWTTCNFMESVTI